MYEILNPNQVVEGKSIPQWTEEWWKWVGERSRDESPLNDLTGEYASLGNDGEVFFVAGPHVVTFDDPDSPPTGVDDGIVQRTFEVPSDTPILVPIMNAVSFNTKKDPLSFYMERFEDLYATIDGEKVEDIKKYNVLSDYFELGPAEEDTVLYDLITGDWAAGDPDRTYNARSDGYWLMMEDLSKGKHKLEFGRFFDYDDNGVFDPKTEIQMAAVDIIKVVEAETPLAAEMLIA